MKRINHLAIKSLKYRKFTITLSIISISLSVILLLGVERIRNQVHESFASTISGTDLIVGARTGSVSLLLSTVFHIGYANQNVSYESYEAISKNPKVAWSIPLSLGDSHKSFPVLGTTDEYFEHFKYGRKQNLEAAAGHLCVHGMGAVIGADVAKNLGYSVGDELIVTHGMGDESFVKHDHDPFTIEAVLKPTGTPVDQTVHVSINSMGAIHAEFYNEEDSLAYDPFAEALAAHQNEHDHHHHAHCNHGHSAEAGGTPSTLTGFMLGLHKRNEVLLMQRHLNTYEDEPLSAIMPVVTLLELWNVVKPIQKTLIIISFLVLIVAFVGMLTTIMTSLNERRREMAILRSVGAKPRDIFQLIIIESFSVTTIGIIVGIIILHLLLLVAKPIISSQLGILINIFDFNMMELSFVSIILLGGLLIGFWPAYLSYKHSLADGLTIKV
ncbi:ABC transporter permease [Carboxylicivirga marina]|uniref:ABC transporter permease n=1 Tax=Carboxylicivirga marina TaxID=2800988 RepID=A0ABS1HGF2_9BACT|nr:ABC transporter permease [Carboxylicivirga marina]MBK3516741.1 ABC transporter permease [Carboxylicivirga marina]